MDHAPPAAWALGQVIFGQTEFQIIDRETEQANEMGDASHDAYKRRQQVAVARRLKLGIEQRAETPAAEPEPARKSRPPGIRKRRKTRS
jgi:hypothetical protein